MSAVAAEEKVSLIEGNRIRCPNDRKLRPIFAYKAFERAAEFEDQLSVVLKCTGCGHIFSLSADTETIRVGMRVNAARMAHVA